MGMALVLATVIGVAAGYAVDRYFHTDPWGFFIGLGMGIVAGFRNLYVIGRRLQRDEGEREGQGRRKAPEEREAPALREGRKPPRPKVAPGGGRGGTPKSEGSKDRTGGNLGHEGAGPGPGGNQGPAKPDPAPPSPRTGLGEKPKEP